MNKFLSIAATAGLLAAFAGVAQATPIVVSGSSPAVCGLTIVTAGSLGPNSTGLPTKVGTTWGVQPELQTICNAGGHSVAITAPAVVFTNSANQVAALPTGYTVAGGFGGGAGVYGSIPNNFAGATTFPVGTTTGAGNDKFSINARIEAPGTSLIQAGSYVATITATLTPQ